MFKITYIEESLFFTEGYKISPELFLLCISVFIIVALIAVISCTANIVIERKMKVQEMRIKNLMARNEQLDKIVDRLYDQQISQLQ